jgi:hypothetical protein
MPPARIPGRLTSSRPLGSARSVIFSERDPHLLAVWRVCHIPLGSCQIVSTICRCIAASRSGWQEQDLPRAYGRADVRVRCAPSTRRRKRGSEPGARTGRPGRSPAKERIGLLLSNGLRPARTCPCLLFLGLFLRLLGDAALCDPGRRFGCCTYRRQRFRWGRRHPRRICRAHDRLRWRLVCSQSGIRSDGGLHQPKEADEKAQVRCNDKSDGRG